MPWLSQRLANLTEDSLALSALPDAPVIPDRPRTPWLRLPSLVRLTVAWNRRAEEHERTWEYRWRAAPACA